MKISTLFALPESVESDIEARGITIQAYRKMSQHINAVKDYDLDIEYGSQGDYLCFDGQKAGLSDLLGVDNIVLMFGLKRAGTVGISASYIRFNELVAGKYLLALRFDCMSELTFANVVSSVNSTSMLSSMQHEIIHLLDDKRTGGRAMSDTKNMSPSEYLNDNAEYNARYHDIADKLTGLIGDMREAPGENPQDFLDLYGITGNFWKDFAQMIGYDHQTRFFMKWINDDRRRALLKRLYKLHGALMDMVRDYSKQAA